MARSLKKGPFIDGHLLKKIETAGPRPRRDVRPQWITDLIDEVAELFEPFTDVGRVARAAQFKQLPLLDGTLGEIDLQVGAQPYDTVSLRFDRTTTAMALGLLRIAYHQAATFSARLFVSFGSLFPDNQLHGVTAPVAAYTVEFTGVLRL